MLISPTTLSQATLLWTWTRNLPKLERLYLNWNQLYVVRSRTRYGTVNVFLSCHYGATDSPVTPKHVGNLTALQLLYLNDNNFTGNACMLEKKRKKEKTILDSINDLTNLENRWITRWAWLSWSCGDQCEKQRLIRLDPVLDLQHIDHQDDRAFVKSFLREASFRHGEFTSQSNKSLFRWKQTVWSDSKLHHQCFVSYDLRNGI